MPSMTALVRVGKVPFGKGVFARQLIRAGEVIGQIHGKLIQDPAYGSSYCIGLDEHYSLEPRAPFRYLNHSCTPNCQLFVQDCVYEDGTPAPPEAGLEAIEDIPEGAELTIDYAWSADAAIRCLCGSEQCRGWVVDSAELPRLKSNPKPK